MSTNSVPIETLPIATLIKADFCPGSMPEFAFELAGGTRVHLSLRDVLIAQRFAESRGAAKLRSAHWWARTDLGDGCLLQDWNEQQSDLPSDG